ncbi:MAG: methyltransferase domain-containing protein [Nitriliruptorales bacterium]|nr:methyltransferase domain-containing protein [Nitriliruptorales bacterium]
MDAGARWAQELEGWAIPPEVLATAPACPYGYNVATFEQRVHEAREAWTPSRREALAALPAGGSVLDVGCGAGAAVLALVPQVGTAVGFDEGEAMLAAFRRRAEAAGVNHLAVQGRWPDDADKAPVAEVVLCHHVFYNAPDLPDFALALTAHARRRVVVELTVEHPLAWTRPLWERLHGLSRPSGPTDEDALAVLRHLGLDVQAEHWEGLPIWRGTEDDMVAFVRRRLALPPERDPEIRTALRDHAPQPREVATVWWPGAADT